MRGERTGQGTGFATRAGARLGSPVVLAVSVVLLVSVLGAVATYSSYRALCKLGSAEAKARLHAESTRLQAAVGGALFVADDLLDRLAPTVRALPKNEPTALLDVLRHLATARAGLTWISVSYPDGTFVGVYREQAVGQLRGSISQITPQGGLERTYALDAIGAPRLVSEKAGDYDPRKRDFYKQAVAKRRRLWTSPYPFLPNHHTGISRVLPLYDRDAADSPSAVLTVDFDASGLSELLGHQESTRDLVLASDGALLACANCVLPGQARWPKDRALRAADLNDPVVRAVAARVQSDRASVKPVVVDGISYLIDVVPIVRLDEASISLVRARDEATLYGPAQAEARKNVLVTALMALIGLGFAFALSSNIARLKRARAHAELLAQEARDEAAELGSYELVELLGHGGMGEVYRARHKLLSREAALKLMRVREDASGDELREAFFLEAKRLASLRSIHTVSVYDFGVASDGRYFLAMELLEGLDLDALVRRYGPQPPGRVAHILAQVCDSLAEAHARGLVHQDIKPANVFLSRLAEALDVVKVLDFGIARAVGPLGARLSRTEGTPAYMSPEQILGDPVGPLSDIYAVGGLGHFLLTGHPPYEGRSSSSIQLAHIEQPIPDLSVASPALAQLITRCLAKSPEHRPVSAAVLGNVLRELAEKLSGTFPDEARVRFWKDFTPQGVAHGEGTAATVLRTARVYSHGRPMAAQHR